MDPHDLELQLAKEEAKRYQSILPPDEDNEKTVGAVATVDVNHDKAGRWATITSTQRGSKTSISSIEGQSPGRRATISSTPKIRTVSRRTSSSRSSSFMGTNIRSSVRRFMKDIAKRMKDFDHDDYDDDDEYCLPSADRHATNNTRMTTQKVPNSRHGNDPTDTILIQSKKSQVNDNVDEVSLSPPPSHSSGNHKPTTDTTCNLRHVEQRPAPPPASSSSRSPTVRVTLSDGDEELRLAKEQARLFQSIIYQPSQDDFGDGDYDDDTDFDNDGDNVVEEASVVNNEGDEEAFISQYHQYRRNSTITNQREAAAAADEAIQDLLRLQEAEGTSSDDEMKRAKEQARRFQFILPSDDEDNLDFALDDEADHGVSKENRDKFQHPPVTVQLSTTESGGTASTCSTVAVSTADRTSSQGTVSFVTSIGRSEKEEEQDEETAVFGDVIDRVETQPPVLMTLADGSTNVVVTLGSSSGNRERNPTNVNKTSGLRTTTTSLKHYIQRRVFVKTCFGLLFATIGFALAVLAFAFIHRGRKSYDQSGTVVEDNSTIIPDNISPTMAPSSSLVQETIEMEQYKDILSLIYDDSSHDGMNPIVVGSEQHLALEWIKSLSVSDSVISYYEELLSGDDDDKLQLLTKTSTIIIRQYYVLAVLYYSFRNPTNHLKWAIPKQPSDIMKPKPETEEELKLAVNDVCSWIGISCRNKTSVTANTTIGNGTVTFIMNGGVIDTINLGK